MMEIPISGPIDLEALEDFLDSDDLGESMTLSEMDGYLTGLAVGPELIAPSEWLPEVWGPEHTGFDSPEQMTTIIGSILRRYNQIIDCLDQDPETLVPIFVEQEEGVAKYGEWAVGFTQAMGLRMGAWLPMLEDNDATVLMLPIAAITAAWNDQPGDPAFELPPEAMADLLANADTVLPICAGAIRAFWQSRKANPKARAKPKTNSRKKPGRDKRHTRH